MITTLMSKRHCPPFSWIGVVGAFFFIAAIGFTSVAGHASESAGGPIVSAALPLNTVPPCREGVSTMDGMSAVPGQANDGNEIRIADHLQTCKQVCKDACGTNSLGDYVCKKVCEWKCVGGSKGHGDPRKKSK